MSGKYYWFVLAWSFVWFAFPFVEVQASPKAAFCIANNPEISMLYRCIPDRDKYIKIKPKKQTA